MSTANHVTFPQTLAVKNHCLCLATQRAARALARRFDEAFRPLGLTSGQFSMLMALNRPEPPPLGPVAELLAMDRTTLTANLKPLERKGLIRSLPNPRDKRSRLLHLTDEGKALLVKAYDIWIGEHGALDSEIGKETGERLRRDLALLA